MLRLFRVYCWSQSLQKVAFLTFALAAMMFLAVFFSVYKAADKDFNRSAGELSLARQQYAAALNQKSKTEFLIDRGSEIERDYARLGKSLRGAQLATALSDSFRGLDLTIQEESYSPVTERKGAETVIVRLRYQGSYKDVKQSLHKALTMSNLSYFSELELKSKGPLVSVSASLVFIAQEARGA